MGRKQDLTFFAVKIMFDDCTNCIEMVGYFATILDIVNEDDLDEVWIF